MKGHETTANALSFGILLLGKHPEIQQKLYQEVNSISFETLSIMESFKACEYTKKCIDETMRLYPPAYFSDRISIKKDSFNGMEISKGSTILISFYELHRNPSIWNNPEKFNPERFNLPIKKEQQNYFFPFGALITLQPKNAFVRFENRID